MIGQSYAVVRQFEGALSEYTGAPYVVTTTSCTSALMLATAYRLKRGIEKMILIPKHTYVGVPMAIIHAGGRPLFDDDEWTGLYELGSLRVYDSARWFTEDLYRWATEGMGHGMVCVSFHHTKTLGLSGHGGAILLDDREAYDWLKRARFDGRTEGANPRTDPIAELGWHCYMTPPTAAEGLQRLEVLPRKNEPLPNSDYPDLSQLEVFK